MSLPFTLSNLVLLFPYSFQVYLLDCWPISDKIECVVCCLQPYTRVQVRWEQGFGLFSSAPSHPSTVGLRKSSAYVCSYLRLDWGSRLHSQPTNQGVGSCLLPANLVSTASSSWLDRMSHSFSFAQTYFYTPLLLQNRILTYTHRSQSSNGFIPRI